MLTPNAGKHKGFNKIQEGELSIFAIRYLDDWPEKLWLIASSVALSEQPSA